MRNLLLGVSILLSSCLSTIMDEPIRSIDPDLEPYYYLFLQEAELRGHDFSRSNIELYFTSHPEYYGYAHQKGGLKVISIDSSYWYKRKFKGAKGRQFKEVLMMHEFGHAFLHRNHTDHCNSIMKVLDSCKYVYYEQNRTESLNELFGH